MIEMMLSPSDLGLGHQVLSSEARDALDDYNQWAGSNYSHAHEEDVEKALDALLILFPQNQAIILRRAQIYFEQDKFELARTDIAFVLTQEPTHVDALMLSVSIAHKAQQDDVLLADLHRLLSLQSFLSDPDMMDDQIRMRSWRRELYIKQELFDLARPDLDYIIEYVEPVQEEYRLFDYYYDALNARSKIFETQGQLEEELADLNALLTPPMLYSQKHLYRAPYGNLHNHSQRALHRLSEIYIAQENYDEASINIDKLLDEEPCDVPALVLRAQVYQALNQHELAVEDEIVVRDLMLLNLEGVKLENSGSEIPSLKTLAKMTFFRYETNMDTSEWVAGNTPSNVHNIFKATKITPEAIHSMRELLYLEAPVDRTVFEELGTYELAAEDWDVGVSNTDSKKRQHDAISSSMS